MGYLGPNGRLIIARRPRGAPLGKFPPLRMPCRALRNLRMFGETWTRGGHLLAGGARIDLVRGNDPRLQHLWLALAQHPWDSLAIVPARAGGSTSEVARALADVGQILARSPVSAITVDVMGPRSALALSTLAHSIRDRRERVWTGNGIVRVGQTLRRELDRQPNSLVPPMGRLIVGVPSLVSEPLGMAVAHAVDGVLLGVELGATSMAEIERSSDLVGRDRIVGVCLL